MIHRLAIISTHPIQYNAPWFALLQEQSGLEVKVFYTWSQRQTNLYDVKFEKAVNWDIPLLDGYEYTFIENSSIDPGNHHFNGIKCPTLIGEIVQWDATHLMVFGWNFHAHLKTMRYFKRKIPVLFRGDSTLLDEWPGIKRFLRRIALTWIYQFVDYGLYTGQSNRHYLKKHGLKDHQLIHAPHAVDNMRFTGNHDLLTEQALKFGSEHGITPEDKVILFVGKFEQKKDPLLLLEAFKQLLTVRKNPSELKLVYVGNGELEASLKETAKEIPGVYFVPFQNQSNMPVVYRLGKVLCLPSKGPGETWGLAINEAMACGRLCLISDKSGCAADLGVYPGSMIFRSGDVNDLVEKLSLLLRKPEFDNSQFLESYNYQRLVDGILTAMKKTSTS